MMVDTYHVRLQKLAHSCTTKHVSGAYSYLPARLFETGLANRR